MESTPIVYKQGGQCYYKPVVLLTSDDNNLTEATSSILDIVEVVFEEEPNANLPPEFYCIAYLRERLGVNIRGNAEDIIPNIEKPFVGAVILMNFNGIAHAGLIQYVLADRIIFRDSNFIEGTPRKNVMIMKNSSNIRGYFFKNPN